MELFEKSRTDLLYPAIMLASGLGLRRSEALGIQVVEDRLGAEDSAAA